MSELLPCPFCGSEAELDDYTKPSEWREALDHGASAQCPKCFAYFYADTAEQAAEKWNRRTVIQKTV